MGRAEAGLQEDTAVGDGLQRGGALVGEAEPYEELKRPRGATVREGWAPQSRSRRKPGSGPPGPAGCRGEPFPSPPQASISPFVK